MEGLGSDVFACCEGVYILQAVSKKKKHENIFEIFGTICRKFYVDFSIHRYLNKNTFFGSFCLSHPVYMMYGVVWVCRVYEIVFLFPISCLGNVHEI